VVKVDHEVEWRIRTHPTFREKEAENTTLHESPPFSPDFGPNPHCGDNELWQLLAWTAQVKRCERLKRRARSVSKTI
jgi:hypothetical protein